MYLISIRDTILFCIPEDWIKTHETPCSIIEQSVTSKYKKIKGYYIVVYCKTIMPRHSIPRCVFEILESAVLEKGCLTIGLAGYMLHKLKRKLTETVKFKSTDGC